MIGVSQAYGVYLSVCQGWNLEPVWKKPCMCVQAAATIKTYSSMGQWDYCVYSFICECVRLCSRVHARVCMCVRACVQASMHAGLREC